MKLSKTFESSLNRRIENNTIRPTRESDPTNNIPLVSKFFTPNLNTNLTRLKNTFSNPIASTYKADIYNSLLNRSFHFLIQCFHFDLV